MPTVTVAHLVHAYVKRPQSSVWIVPGSLDDFEDPINEELYPHINDYLPKRGVLIASKVTPIEADELIAETVRKFRYAGIEASADSLCDD
ncbi:MAG: hypothetical protein AAF750_02550 [Planctomycetota bacterium]